MGAESRCTLERDGRRTVGSATLESDHILFRGATERLKLSLASITKLDARGDALLVERSGDALLLHLAPGTSTKWLAARRAGLVDNKVAAFSATHTAERLVIPLNQR